MTATKGEDEQTEDRDGKRTVRAAMEAGTETSAEQAHARMRRGGKTAVAGHFLRGHAGSVAYTLAVAEGADWDAMLGVDRARHTLASFKKSYARGVVPRLTAAFRNHRRRGKLRFEEAARL